MGWGYKCFQWPLGRGAEDVDVGHREDSSRGQLAEKDVQREGALLALGKGTQTPIT